MISWADSNRKINLKEVGGYNLPNKSAAHMLSKSPE
jgi:hypothetical protein